MTRRALVAALAATALGAAGSIAAGPVVPDAVPDRIVGLSNPIARGEVVTAPATLDPVRGRRTIDGRTDDWAGTPSRIGGATVVDRGEVVHSDFLFDAHGADDGGDRARLQQFADLLYVEDRAARLDQVARTSGSQLGVPEPVGAPDEYGDADGGLDVGDLHTLRLGTTPSGRDVDLAASVTNLDDPARLGVLVLADTTGQGEPDAATDLLGSGLRSGRYDVVAALVDGGGTVTDLRSGDIAEVPVVVDANGYGNTLEARLPARLVAPEGVTDVAVVTARVEDDGTWTPLNVAFRAAEPLEIYNDRLQAFALLDGTVDAFSSGPVVLDDLRRGVSAPFVAPGPGYHEVQHVSDPSISVERGQDGVRQPYGLYVPTRLASPTPVTYWLHYRGGKAHSGVVINPRLVTQLGEERDDVVVFPHARGTSEWYVTEAHQDVLEVMADAEARFDVDPTRRYVSGYSMGGYGSWLFASLYPDLFAAGFVQSGAVTQGLWAGTGAAGDPVDPLMGGGFVEANGGDAAAQLTHVAIDNLRHVPFAIDHGTFDELVPITAIERMAQKLLGLGYEHRLTRLVGYEHFSQAATDEWADGAAFLDRHVLDPTPREVTYRVVPALVHALNTVDPPQGAVFGFDPDGAYWLDDIEVRDEGDRGDGRPGLDVVGQVDAVATALEPAPGLLVPEVGAASPPDTSTPYVRTGLQRVADPTGALAPAPAAVDADLLLTATNVRAVTVDAAAAGLDLADVGSLLLEVTTDGPLQLRLAGVLRGVDADLLDVTSVDGWRVDGDDLVLDLVAGAVQPRITVG